MVSLVLATTVKMTMQKCLLIIIFVGLLSAFTNLIGGDLAFSSEFDSSGSAFSSSEIIKPKISRDTYYKVEGPVSGFRALRVTAASYPQEFWENRVVMWIVTQQSVYWSGFVTARLFWWPFVKLLGGWDGMGIRAVNFLRSCSMTFLIVSV